MNKLEKKLKAFLKELEKEDISFDASTLATAFNSIAANSEPAKRWHKRLTTTD